MVGIEPNQFMYRLALWNAWRPSSESTPQARPANQE